MKSGAPGLNVAFALPTINGLGSDHLLARGEIGRDGVPVNSLEDVEQLFDGIPLGEVSTSLVIAYPPIPCMYIATAEKQGVKPGQLRGTFQNDSICRDVGANVRVLPRRAELKLCVDVVEQRRLVAIGNVDAPDRDGDHFRFGGGMGLRHQLGRGVLPRADDESRSERAPSDCERVCCHTSPSRLRQN